MTKVDILLRDTIETLKCEGYDTIQTVDPFMIIKIWLERKAQIVTDQRQQILKENKTDKDSLLISIKTIIGKPIHIYCFKHSTIEDIKEQILNTEGIPADQIRLIFNGKQLEDGRTVEEYGIINESALHMVLRLRGGMYATSSGKIGLNCITKYNKKKDESVHKGYVCDMCGIMDFGGMRYHSTKFKTDFCFNCYEREKWFDGHQDDTFIEYY